MGNRRISTKLIVVLVTVTGLLVLLRLEGAWRTKTAVESLTDMFRQRVVPMAALHQIAEDVTVAMVRTPERLMLRQVAPPDAVATIDAAWKRIDDSWRAVAGASEGIEERQRMTALREVLDAARRVSMASKADIQAHGTAIPPGVIAELFKQADEVGARSRDLVTLHFDLAEQAHAREQREYRRGVLTSLVFAAVALAVVVLIGRSTVRFVSRSLGRVTQHLQALAAGEGNLAARMPVTTEDEIGELSEAFNALMEKLRALVRRVQESASKVATSAAELADTVRRQEGALSEQAASTEAARASAGQIAQTAGELAHTMREISDVTEQAVDLADTGRANLVRMERTIRNVQVASRSISDRLAAINAKAANITGVVTTIGKVAEQTNLLSLNASIEAAKAGEFGHGFGVVAREIRRLADQTATASQEIDETVKEMQAAVSSGVMSMERFTEEVRTTVADVSDAGAQLGRVIDQVSVLGPRFLEVGRGMTSQSQGAQQISAAVGELSVSATGSLATLKESARAIAQLEDAARELQREVERFAGV
jgi:methyl-accepting chemotaxis protein WspA